MTREIHLVGSAPVPDARSAFETFGGALKHHARRYPDGEPGERHDWVLWQKRVFAQHPDFEPAALPGDPRAAIWKIPTYRLRRGRRPADVAFKDIGYARAAIDSYRLFQDALASGALPQHARFQVSLPTAVACIWFFVAEPAEQAGLLSAYERALMDEVRRIAGAVPEDRLAIQWDAAVEPIRIEKRRRNGPDRRFRDWISEIPDLDEYFGSAIGRLCAAVPAGVDCLLHLCYGDFGHQHLLEPSDMQVMVDLANRVLARVQRPVELLHMPVPRARHDDAYFAPLRDLRLPPATRLALGLVHYTDGFAGSIRRLVAAGKYASDFAVATECGLGRRPADTLGRLLDLHVKVADA